MKSIAEYINESLFDENLAKQTPTTLLDMFGRNVSLNKVENVGSLGWTRSIYSKGINNLWKKEGSPKLKGNLSGFNPTLQKLSAIILKNVVIDNPKKTTQDILDLLKNDEEFKISESDPRMIKITDILYNEEVLYEFLDDNDNPVPINDAWGISINIKHPRIFKKGWFKGVDGESIEMSICITANYPYVGGCVIKLEIKL